MWRGSEGKMSAALVQMSCWYRGMLAVRAAGPRTSFPGLGPSHLRAFSVRKEPQLEENPFYSKYQQKIQQLRSAKPQEFKERLERRQEAQKEALGRSQQAEFVRLVEEEVEKRAQRPEGASGGFTRNKTLDSILHVDMVRDKPAEDVAQLWMEYFSTKDTISAVIPTQTYERIHGRSRSCPTFVFALPQKQGYEFVMGQWAGHQLHFTSLINVHTLGEDAPSQLVLYHYPELKEDKGVVFMTAERDPRLMSVQQAQCLANQVQLFYGTQRQETFRLVETFNQRPAEFDHMLVIAELEQSGLGASSGLAVE